MRSIRRMQRTLHRGFDNGFLRPVRRAGRKLVPRRLLDSASRTVQRSSRTVQRSGRSVTRAAASVTDASDRGRHRRRWWHLAVGLPALVVLVVAITVTVRASGNQRQLGRAYWQRGLAAIGREDFSAAQLFLSRAKNAEGVDSREIDFALAVVYERLGMQGRSMEIFQRLAPIDRTGFGKAHRHLAITISRRSSTLEGTIALDPETLTRWLWHLSHADEQESSPMQEAWGNYYVAVDDLPAAIQSYSAAAAKFPQLYLKIANLQGRLGQATLRTETLERSKRSYRERLTANPNDRDSRILYATTLMALGELSEAERVLQTGKRIDPDGPYDGLLAAMYVQLHDQLSERGRDPQTDEDTRVVLQAEAIRQLRNSLAIDPNFAPALNRVLGYAQVEPAAIEELRTVLMELLADGRGTAMAHLALSNLAWLENKVEDAAFHLEQAIALDERMPVIANNLAWLLAHADPPQHERSLKLIDRVLQTHGENARFLDTRGTILGLMGRHREALVDLEKALPSMPDAGATHGRIAASYEALGMDDLAKLHRRQAGELD